MNNIFIIFVLLFCFSGVVTSAMAEDKPLTVKEVAEKQAAQDTLLKKLEQENDKKVSKDEFNRLTPRSTMVGLSLALRDKDYVKAENYLDLRHLPFSGKKQLNGEELAKKLSIIADRAINVSLGTFSDDPKGLLNDGLSRNRDLIDSVDTADGDLALYLQRMKGPHGLYIWKVSNDTVAKIPTLYSLYGYTKLSEMLSDLIPDYNFMGMHIKLWQVVLILGFLVVGYLFSILITFPFIKFLKFKNEEKKKRFKRFMSGPLRFFIMIVIVRYFFDEVSPSHQMKAAFEAGTLLLLAGFWLLSGLVDLVMGQLVEKMQNSGQTRAAVLLRPTATGIKIILLLLTILLWMDSLGYKVTTILTGLGVGSLAVALAAQKSLENLIGSITVYAAQPVKVGDLCKFGDTLGVVEEIGLRSTKIRTLARSIVDIPNAVFAGGKIENLTERDKILYRTRLKLSYKVSMDQIRSVLQHVRELFAEHEYVDEETSRIRFIEFGEYAHELELYLYIKTKEHVVYLEQIEALNFSILGILEQDGVKLAVPETLTHFQKSAEDSML